MFPELAPDLTMDALNALQAAYNDATQGKWIADDDDSLAVWHLESGGTLCEPSDLYPRGDNRPVENMRLIAAMHEALPALIHWAGIGLAKVEGKQ